MTKVVAELASVVGAEHVLAPTQAASYGSDATHYRGLAGTPAAVVRPGSVDEVSQVLAACGRLGVSIVPRGGGTGLAGGAVPVHGEVVVSLERLRRVREISPERWQMTVEAGVTTEHVKRLAAENGLYFPPDPGAGEQSHIGGNVATNAGGPHALKYGPTGDWVLGLEVVLASGEILQVGSGLRKDVTGLRLADLLIGSEGTLGLITAVTLRLLPAREASLPLVGFFASNEAACHAVSSAIAYGNEPAALEFIDLATMSEVGSAYPSRAPARVAAVLADFDGSHAEAAAARNEFSAVLEEASATALDEPVPALLWRWRDGISTAVSTIRGGKVSEDIAVPVDRLAEAVNRIHHIGSERELATYVWGHAGDGNLHPSFLVDPQEPEDIAAAEAAAVAVFALALELGGSASGEHGIGWLKRAQVERQLSLGQRQAQWAIKRALDPQELLNPGKKLGDDPQRTSRLAA
jgi:glycolate oxidase subunit GlcD